MKQICEDLKTEHGALDAILSDLNDEKWQIMTPSPGWNIKDQVRHLAYFDDRGALSATDPEAFGRHIEEILKDIEGFKKTLDEVGRDMSTKDLLNWWRKERTTMVEAFGRCHPKDRLPWYGPPMSALSFATAGQIASGPGMNEPTQCGP